VWTVTDMAGGGWLIRVTARPNELTLSLNVNKLA
jgi:hypothetical protein